MVMLAITEKSFGLSPLVELNNIPFKVYCMDLTPLLHHKVLENIATLVVLKCFVKNNERCPLIISYFQSEIFKGLELKLLLLCLTVSFQ